MAQRFGESGSKDAAKQLNLSKRKLSAEKRAISPEKQKRLNGMILNAAEKGKEDEIKRLLKAGASIEAKDIHGRTALMIAAEYGHTKTCALLIEHNASIDAKDKDGITALTRAVCYGHTKTKQFLELMESFSKLMGKENFKSFLSSFRECTQ